MTNDLAARQGALGERVRWRWLGRARGTRILPRLRGSVTAGHLALCGVCVACAAVVVSQVTGGAEDAVRSMTAAFELAANDPRSVDEASRSPGRPNAAIPYADFAANAEPAADPMLRSMNEGDELIAFPRELSAAGFERVQDITPPDPETGGSFPESLDEHGVLHRSPYYDVEANVMVHPWERPPPAIAETIDLPREAYGDLVPLRDPWAGVSAIATIDGVAAQREGNALQILQSEIAEGRVTALELDGIQGQDAPLRLGVAGAVQAYYAGTRTRAITRRLELDDGQILEDSMADAFIDGVRFPESANLVAFLDDRGRVEETFTGNKWLLLTRLKRRGDAPIDVRARDTSEPLPIEEQRLFLRGLITEAYPTGNSSIEVETIDGIRHSFTDEGEVNAWYAGYLATFR